MKNIQFKIGHYKFFFEGHLSIFRYILKVDILDKSSSRK